MEEVQQTRDEWIKISTQFMTNPGQEIVQLTFNADKTPLEFYMDDIILSEVKPGVIAETELSYCDSQKNLLINSGLNTSEFDACETTSLKISVSKNTVYTFAATVEDGTANDSLFVSFDGINPINKSKSDTAAASVISGENKNTRTAYQFVSNSDGYIYLVTKNNSGKFKYSNVSLFKTYATSTNFDVGREESTTGDFNKITEIETLSTTNPFVSVEPEGETEDFEDEESGEYGENYDLGNSPETGDNTLIPVALIILTLIAVSLLMLCRKENKVNE